MNDEKETIVYKGINVNELPVLTDGETVWLTMDQMVKLFGRHQSVISRHIKSVFDDGELPKEGYMQILHKTSSLGGRPLAYYALDVVISVGYRVKSHEGVKFRIWATKCLREIMLHKIKTDHRLEKVEERLTQVENGLAYLEEQISTEPELFYPEDRELIGFKPKK